MGINVRHIKASTQSDANRTIRNRKQNKSHLYKSLFLHIILERNLFSALACPFPFKPISLKVPSFPEIPLATSLWKQYWLSDKTNPVTWLWWSHFTKESGEINVSSVQTSEHLTVLKSWNAKKKKKRTIFRGKEWVKRASMIQNKAKRDYSNRIGNGVKSGQWYLNDSELICVSKHACIDTQGIYKSKVQLDVFCHFCCCPLLLPFHLHIIC